LIRSNSIERISQGGMDVRLWPNPGAGAMKNRR
jgi:hypothetical protein